MAHSGLINAFVPAYSGNYTNGRSGRKIEAVTIHHMAGVMTAEACGAIFQRKGRNGSSHYGIGNDGRIGCYVEEENTAWTNSNWDSNCKSVTIETSNSSAGGDWPVSDAAYNSLIKLVADIANRNGLGKLVPEKNLTWHSMFTATACPGPYLKARIQDIADKANAINFPPEPTPEPTPEPAKDNTIHEGDVVKPKRLVSYDGVKLKQYDNAYVVTQLRGDRAVLSAQRGTQFVVWAAMRVEDLEKC